MAAASTPAYRKLTRMKRGLGTMSQLALGPDHLLHVQSTGYTESYRRFYLRDIQAILVVHTARRLIWTAVLCLLALIALLFVSGFDGGVVPTAIVCTITLALLLWNFLRGRGCRLVIITAVQQESVSAVTRLPKARRVLAELRPLIEAAQVDFAAPLAPLAAPAGAQPPPIAAATIVPPPLPSS